MQLETGVFLFMLAFSFGFMFWSFFRVADKFTHILRVISCIVFLGMSLFVGAGYEVSSTSTETTVSDYEGINPLSGQVVLMNSTDTITKKDIIIPEGTEGAWMGYIFTGFAILNMILVVRDVWQ